MSNVVKARVSRDKMAAAGVMTSGIPEFTEISVDLDDMRWVPVENPKTGKLENTLMLAEDNGAIVPIAFLEFDPGLTLPDPPERPADAQDPLHPDVASDEWASNLPDDAVERLREFASKIEEPGNVDFSAMARNVTETLCSAIEDAAKVITRHERPFRVKFIEETTYRRLGRAVNAFLDEGHEILSVSERVHRQGNILAVEIRYFLPRPQGIDAAKLGIRTEAILNTATGQKGTRYTMPDGHTMDIFGDPGDAAGSTAKDGEEISGDD